MDQKASIEEELKKPVPDWHRIEALSRQKVDEDPKAVRFSVDAGHIQKLGLELVAKQETALVELIKNAYDADALSVKVSFQGHDSAGGRIIIEDDGSGMTTSVVRTSWMTISTADKSDTPISPKYERIRAGKKGIGRFAVQRLGKKLILETGTVGSQVGLRVEFRWDEAFLSGVRLQDVFSTITEYAKDPTKSGTRLIIEDTREPWSETEMVRVWRAVLLLQPPFKAARSATPVTAVGRSADPGFEVQIDGVSNKKKHIELSIESKLLAHAIAEISGEIGEDGRASVTLRSPKLGVEESQSYDQHFLLTGPVKFSARYFIYTSDAIPGMMLKTAQDLGRSYGGVRIYRNGFRVLPYGESSDDWLKLDFDVSRRALLTPGNNRNFFGEVEIDAETNPLLEETSSRQGLVENTAFDELRTFVRTGTEWAMKRVANLRARKERAGQRDFESVVRGRKPSEAIAGLLESATATSTESADATPKVAIVPQVAIQSLKVEFEEWEREVEEQKLASLQYEEMLRILASLGLTISVFGHEIKGARSSVSGHIALLTDLVETVEPSDTRRDLAKLLEGLKVATSRMFDIGGYILGLMSSTGSRDLNTLSVRGAIDRFCRQFKEYMERQHVQFSVDVSPTQLRTTEMHASELDSVLLNFLTNSIKAMKKARVAPRIIRISARQDGDFVVIAFEDNGVGIAPEHADRVFEPFFTTTMDADDDVVAGPGTGLGLKIVSDIAQSYGGSVAVGVASEGYTCRMEFRVLSSMAQEE